MKDSHVRHRMVFLEDYDMSLARSLVQGVDVWLNNPMKRHEASGTSGMKSPPNGGINLSVLDGWWPEAFDGSNGWAIGDRRIYNNDEYQDFFESESLYELLEKDVIPMFYDRGPDGLPRRWIARMKSSMRTIPPVFNTNRWCGNTRSGCICRRPRAGGSAKRQLRAGSTKCFVAYAAARPVE